MNSIFTIFGKKGSGKSTLSKELMVSLGGRVVFLSLVESTTLPHTEAWDIDSIESGMEELTPGSILLVRLAGIDAMEAVACQALYDGGGFTIVIDEVENFKHSSSLVQMIHYSRHFNINIIANTRRYADVPRLLTSQSDGLFVAHTLEPIDLKYVRGYMDTQSLEAIALLNLYEFWTYPEKKIRKTRDLGF